MNTDSPDFLLHNDQLYPSAAGQAFHALKARVEREAAQLDRAWAGAFLASIVQPRPWLAAFDLTITVSHEYDDQGGTYACYSASIAVVRIMDGMALPGTVLDSSGRFDADLAADELAQLFDDCQYDVHIAFEGEGGSVRDLHITVERERIASLFASQPVSGLAAFRALFPDLPA